ncbi:hypothetical protein AB0M11_31640 [Streptomyces sp. NPDC051987]|uniref:hypothetical protein n=1 Tax=Streptomyces sp. NPDC051987 TaxID=3155808 RepID=UPI0034361126
MKKLAQRIVVTVSAVAVTGATVLGAGGAAAAAAPASAHAPHPAVRTEAASHAWDHGVGYLLEQGYTCDETHGWHLDHTRGNATRHDCDGLFYRDGRFFREDSTPRRWTFDT